MMQILEELTPLSRVICSTDFDRTVSRVAELLPCRILEYPGHRAGAQRLGHPTEMGCGFRRP